MKEIRNELVRLTNQIGMENPFIVHMWNLFEKGSYTSLKWYMSQCK